MRHYNTSSRTSLFAQNFLWIGNRAWQGYLNFDRGIVAISSPVDLFGDADARGSDSLLSDLNFRYVPQPQLAIYLQEWLIPDRSIEPIITAVTNYHPQTELIFAIESNTNLDIGWCQNLKISPPDCYQQVCRRWVADRG
ncbi:hypothetical protein [Chamaesiphon sp. OTE_8_metabat_110]|uniref:hypothetical protein n=1 Tax=Chamaesiphon sp. OTE_8_metabat_110 TaxID=2964696 RepID=UPI00286D15E7|nr:hypothetical protein [Chamaesiphon sp. OTE_8_metabat_110]